MANILVRRVTHAFVQKGFPVDRTATQAVFSRFPYGLYVVTVAHGGDEHGMTANWLTQASADPPMLAVAVENNSRTIELIRDARHFAVSLLTTGQRELAAKLGRPSEQAPQKLKGIKTKPAAAAQTPVLSEAVGWVECRVVATLPAGDHTLILGAILDAGVENGEATPLTMRERG